MNTAHIPVAKPRRSKISIVKTFLSTSLKVLQQNQPKPKVDFKSHDSFYPPFVITKPISCFCRFPTSKNVGGNWDPRNLLRIRTNQLSETLFVWAGYSFSVWDGKRYLRCSSAENEGYLDGAGPTVRRCYDHVNKTLRWKPSGRIIQQSGCQSTDRRMR